MKLSVTKFRQNIYKFLDKVISTGISIEFKRKGVIIKIILEKPDKVIEYLINTIDLKIDDISYVTLIDYSLSENWTYYFLIFWPPSRQLKVNHLIQYYMVQLLQ